MGKHNTGEGEKKRIHYTVDTFREGVAFGQHTLRGGEDPDDHYYLRVQEDSEVITLRGRYSLNNAQPLPELEGQLMRLSRQGHLRSAVIYFGTTTDPFHPFSKKFDASMQFLQLFKRYLPGLLVIQTRSPLLVLAMPVLRQLGEHVSVTIGIETDDEEAIARYTPGFPRAEERFKVIRTLRRFGVEVGVQVNPVLPYGDWRKDAEGFAERLAEVADFVTLGALSDGTEKTERRIRKTPLARKLAADRRFHWLRPDADRPLERALESIAPEKLNRPKRQHLRDPQLGIFAA